MPSLEQIQTARLKSGVALVNAAMPFTEAVTILFLLRVGSRDEAARVAGISHLFEHMLFKGATNYPTPKIVAEQVEGVGGIFNAFTDREMTGYWCKLPRRHYERGLNVIADMVKRPLLNADDLEREKQVVIEELRAYYDAPASRASQILDAQMWRDHPLGREIGGTIETVRQVERADMTSFLDERYVTSNLTVAIAGNVRQDELTERLEPLLAELRDGAPPAPAAFESEINGPTLEVEERPIEQARLAIGALGASLTSPDRYALAALSAILGESMSGRLFTEVREKRGLAYDIGSVANYLTDTGSFEIDCGVAPDNVSETLKVVLGELERLHDEEVSDAELEQGVELTRGRWALRLEDSRAAAQFAGVQKLLLDEARSPEEFLADIAAVSKADVKQVARKYLRREKLAVAVVGPVKERAQILATLKG